MARRLNRLVSIVLSAALFILSFGLDAQTAAAQTLSARVVPASPAPQVGLGSSLSAPSFATPATALSLSAAPLLAPSLVVATPAPVISAAPLALTPAAPAAAVAQALKAAAPALKALSKPETGGAAAAGAGRDLENILTGARSAASTGEVPEVAGVESARSSALSPAAATPETPKPDAVPAAAPAAFKTISSASSYSFHRLVLKAVASFTGAVYTMPQASPALSAKIIATAADKSLVLSDFDDTLAGYNEVLPAEKVAAVAAIRKAGKHFAVISDRGDTKRPGATQLTVFESLESIPVAERAGMFVAANSGGKVYRYDENGVPQKVHEAAGLTPDQLEQIKAAAAVTKARLSEVGAVAHTGDEKTPGESFNTYGYALMLKPGSTQDAVKGAARILNEELAKRGFEVEVQPRFAKDPANPPYTTFSIITKAEAAGYIAKALEIEAKDSLVIGDAMFIPRDAKKASWLTRLGEKLSGRPQVKTGNETDRNMTKLLPGVLALGVGGAMDPRVENGWALDGHGPATTQKVLEAVASKARRVSGSDDEDGVGNAIQIGLILAIIAGAGAGYYFLASAIAEIIALGEQAIRESLHNGPFGHGQDLFMLGTGALGAFGMLGANRDRLGNPNETYGIALKRASEIAVELGSTAADVRFVEATASMPAHEGSKWKFTFSVPGSLIYVDFSTFLGEPSQRTSVYRGAPSPEGVTPVALASEQFSSLVVLDAEHAGLLLRNELKGFGSGASVSLAARAAADGNGSQMTYKLYDDHGSEGTVGAAGAFVRVDKVSDKAAKAGAKKTAVGMTTAVEPNELYALALANMREQAIKDGNSPDRIQFLSAVHETRTFNGAWIGDEWRFFFASGGLRYKVPARRTMVSETMMDAFAPERAGLTELGEAAQGVAAGMFEMGVKITPDAALSGIEGVTRVSLLPRVEPVSGDKDLWYSLQSGGDEIAAVNARTGERRVTSAVPAVTDSNLKSFLIWLLGAALVLAVYGGLYWAMSHAPAAVPQGVPQGYNGPIPSIDEVFRGMGGFLGLGLVAGTLKRAKKAKVTDDEIRAAAASVVSSKGRPWSQTEYNMGYYNTLESLKTRGATKKQIALYEKLCADAPIKGGSFNPWSGD